MKLDVVLSPGEFQNLKNRDLSGVTCVVFDILRATTSMTVALANGAAAIIPVQEIAEAVEIRRNNPDFLLAGERHGLRITAELTGELDFEYGNSPREFSRGVENRTIVMTTTNGTRALKACEHAEHVMIGSFLNLKAVISHLELRMPASLLLVCAGTYEEASFEDVLAAGAVADGLWDYCQDEGASDAAQIVREIFRQNSGNLNGAMRHARNGRRLLKIPELRDDVPFCLQRDLYDFTAALKEGCVRRTAVL